MRKSCFPFLWSGKKEADGIPLVKWSKLAMPKELGGCGIKNLVRFSKALAAKILWRLIHNQMFWGKVMVSKYMDGSTFEEWFRRPRKSVSNSSLVWKALVDAFPLIGDWQVRIGEDPREGSAGVHKLSEDLVSNLHNHGIITLRDACVQNRDDSRRSVWISAVDLGIEGDQEEEWGKYISNLRENFITLNEEDWDSLCWAQNGKSGNYTVKLRYLALAEGSFSGLKSGGGY